MQLIKGKFKSQDALTIITQLVDIKIRFHEEKINSSANEEDIKMRESRIKELQKYLKETRDHLIDNPGEVNMDGFIDINSINMANEKFSLINGTFRPDDAKEILVEAFRSKIKFHSLAAFSKRERGDEGAEMHDARIAELENTLKNLRDVLETYKKSDKNISISCTVSIHGKNDEKHESVLQQEIGYSH